jgi:hypothetical protein
MAIPLLFLLLCPTQAQEADSLEYALSFYPIQIGNQWDYYNDGNELIPPEKSYINIQVIGDTLIHGHRYHILRQRRWYEEFWVAPEVWILRFDRYTYERIDSASGNVYAWAAHFDSPRDVLIDRLFAKPRTELQTYRMTYLHYSIFDEMVDNESPTIFDSSNNTLLFGREHVLRTYVNDQLILIGYQLADSLGIVAFHFGGPKFPDSQLVYARINDEEFGERIFTNLYEPETRPVAVSLHPNYPNPFNPSTTLRYDLDEPGPVRLEVYDLTGRRVALLVDGPAPAGRHTAEFNAAGLASGFYIARLNAGGTIQHRKMLLVR